MVHIVYWNGAYIEEEVSFHVNIKNYGGGLYDDRSALNSRVSVLAVAQRGMVRVHVDICYA